MSKRRIKFYTFFLFVLLSIFILPEITLADNRYWVGGTDGANTSDSANWSSSDPASCTGGGASVPTSADTIIFDADCDNGATINTNLTVGYTTINSGYAGTITVANGITFTNNYNFTQAAGTFNGGSGNVTIKNIFTVSGGAFNGGSGLLTIYTDSTLSGGTFTASSATTTFISGTFTHTVGGTFNHNNGTVVISNGADSTINVNNSIPENFYNLVVAKGHGGWYTVSSGDTIIVNGNLTLTDGGLMVGTTIAKGNVTIASTFDTSSATLRIDDDDANVVTPRILTFNGGYAPNVVINNLDASVAYNATTIFKSLNIQNLNGTFSVGANNLTCNGTFTQSGGTFNGGSGTFYVAGAYTLSGGTFTASSATSTFITNYYHTLGGTFNHNNGTVLFYFGAGDGTMDVSNTGDGEVFYNLTVNKANGGWLTQTTGDVVTVTGTLILTDGLIRVGNVKVKGNVVIASTFDGGTSVISILDDGLGTARTVTFNGGYAPNVVLNNPNATVVYNTATIFASLTITDMFLDVFNINGVNLTATTLTVNSGETFKLLGSENVSITNTSFNTGSTIEYSATSGSNAIKDWSYSNTTLKINGPGGTFTLPGSKSFGSLDITAGTLDQGARNITLSSTGTTTIGAGGVWNNSSTGDITLGSGGVVNDGILSFISNNIISSSTKDILILSTTNGSAQRPWTGTGLFNLINVSVRDQGVAGGASITAYYSTDVSNNGANWSFEGSDSPNRNWKGTISSTWSLAGNWVEGSAPTATTSAVFSSWYSNPANFDVSASSPLSIQITNGYNSTVSLAKDISISSYTQTGGIFNLSDKNLSVSGNFTHTGGTFNGNTGTVILTGEGGNQQIIGTTTFSNLRKNVTSSSTLTFGSDQTTTVTGTTSLKGTAGNLLSLRSSINNSQWKFDPQGTLDLAYLSVKDSNNINASTTATNSNINVAPFPGIVDGSSVGTESNTNWTFILPTITVSATGTQATSTPMPITNKYMGGAFVVLRNTGTSTISSIKLTQVGTLPTEYISKVQLLYATSTNGLCSTSTTPIATAGALEYGSKTSWNTSSTTVIYGSLSVGSVPMCLYTRFSLEGAALNVSLLGSTIDLEITNPGADVISSQTTIIPSTAVNIESENVQTLVNGRLSLAPSISLSASPSYIYPLSNGTGTTTISWNVVTDDDSTTCSASGSWSGAKSFPSGSQLIDSLSYGVHTYTLACNSPTYGPAETTINVNVVDPRKPITHLSATPTSISAWGQQVLLSWYVSSIEGYPATGCVYSSTLNSLAPTPNEGAGFSGPINQPITYSLSCGNSYGTTTSIVNIGNNSIIDDCDSGLSDSNDCGTGSGTTPTIVLNNSDGTITKYIVTNGKLWELLFSTDGITLLSTKLLTAPGLLITEASFKNVSTHGVRVYLKLKKYNPLTVLVPSTVEKTFTTTAIIRKN